MPVENSRIPGFYKMSIEERLQKVKELVGLSEEEAELLRKWGGLDPRIADTMIENVIGSMPYPFAVATNFRINGRDYLVPMVIEESSVVAAASNAARFMREGDGIRSFATEPLMISQIHLVGVDEPYEKGFRVLERKKEVLELANSVDKVLVQLGGGARDLEMRVIPTERGKVLTFHLIVDVRDAMGANAVNSMAERVAPLLEEITGGRAVLRIISNLADRRLVRSSVVVSKEALGGEEVVELIAETSAIAAADPYRAATHNKGIMNGVIAVALATGQDHRALEAGAHAYAARNGFYTTLTRWYKTREGLLAGTLEMPMAVGIIGGATKVHPLARVALKILGVKTAKELAEVMGAVGLAQNFAALRALATEGIQRGHMKLHAKNLAIMAGASPEEAAKIAEALAKQGPVTFDRAKELLEKLRRGEPLGA